MPPHILELFASCVQFQLLQEDIDKTWVEAAARLVQACTARCSAEDEGPIARELAAKFAAVSGPTDPLLAVAAAAATALRPGMLHMLKASNCSAEARRQA